MEWMLNNLLLIAGISAFILVLLIPKEIWGLLLWAAAVALSGLVAFYAFILWVTSLE